MTDDDKTDDIEIVNAVMPIKNLVYRERMTKKTILECNKKVKNLNQNIKSNFLQKNFEKMTAVLDDTNSMNYKKIALKELEKFKKSCIEEHKKDNEIK